MTRIRALFARRRPLDAMHCVFTQRQKMYVSIGSRSNVSDNAAEENRARIFEFNPDGSGQKVYA
jgi:glucose/arabinose dehydrogenase